MKKPSPALLVSAAALAVALGGTSYAAVQLNGKNIASSTVTGKQIKNKSLTGKDVRNGSIKGKDLKDGTIAAPTRWVLINAAGQIEAQSGGFSIIAAYPTLPNTSTGGAPDNSLRANGNVYINANEPLSNNGLVASVVLENSIDQNADTFTNGRAPGADANPEFSGEIALSQCGTPITACAPPGAAVNNVFVVSPRLSNGQATGLGGANDRKRFYVVINGDSADYVAPAA